MCKIPNGRLGEIEAADSSVIKSRRGIPGFDDYQILMIRAGTTELTFFFLQSLEAGFIAASGYFAYGSSTFSMSLQDE